MSKKGVGNVIIFFFFLGGGGGGVCFFFFFNDTATTEIYTLSLHDALPICFFDNKKKVIKLKFAIICARK